MLREDHPVSSEMKCLFSQCKFDTDGEIDAKSIVGEKLQLMAFQVQVLHTPEPAQLTPAPSVQPATQRRKRDKFPRHHAENLLRGTSRMWMPTQTVGTRATSIAGCCNRKEQRAPIEVHGEVPTSIGPPPLTLVSISHCQRCMVLRWISI